MMTYLSTLYQKIYQSFRKNLQPHYMSEEEVSAAIGRALENPYINTESRKFIEAREQAIEAQEKALELNNIDQETLDLRVNI